MKLLDLNTIKKKQKDDEIEKIMRAKKLEKLETELIRSVNKKKEEFEIEKKRIDNNLREYKKNNELKKRELEKDVLSLESRRADAMKPIKHLAKEAELKMEKALNKEKENEEEENRLKKENNSLLDRLDSLSDKEQEIKEQEEDLNSRQKKVKLSEESNKQSTKTLNKAWSKFHKDANEINRKLLIRKNNVEIKEKSNEEFKKLLDEKESKLKQEKIAIQDSRGVLERAWKQFYLNKKNHG
jgi:hypothetical protein